MTMPVSRVGVPVNLMFLIVTRSDPSAKSQHVKHPAADSSPLWTFVKPQLPPLFYITLVGKQSHHSVFIPPDIEMVKIYVGNKSRCASDL